MRTCLLSSLSPDLCTLRTQEWWKKWCRSWLRMKIPYVSGLQTRIAHFIPAQQSRSCSCVSFLPDALVYHLGYVFTESCQHFTHGASHRSKLWRLIWTQQRRTWRPINERSSSSWMKFWLWFRSSSTRWGAQRGCPPLSEQYHPTQAFPKGHRWGEEQSFAENSPCRMTHQSHQRMCISQWRAVHLGKLNRFRTGEWWAWDLGVEWFGRWNLGSCTPLTFHTIVK